LVAAGRSLDFSAPFIAALDAHFDHSLGVRYDTILVG
jgi:hypothetical protein